MNISSEQLPPDFSNFLIHAKRATYASGGGNSVTSVPPLVPGTHQLDYREGAYFYRDIYAGGHFFAGQEIIYLADQPFWSMVYSGGRIPGMVGDEEIQLVYTFLRSALRLAPLEAPFRGPKMLREASFTYTNDIHGSLERFWGEEQIEWDGKLVYSLKYSGGKLV
jgi:hypothetical protein